MRQMVKRELYNLEVDLNVAFLNEKANTRKTERTSSSRINSSQTLTQKRPDSNLTVKNLARVTAP